MRRRAFLVGVAKTLMTLVPSGLARQVFAAMQSQTNTTATKAEPITLFLCGDVMTGRGIDQVLPQPSRPQLHEPYVSNALRYVELAEALNGPIPRPVAFDYIWGDALRALDHLQPDVRIINLETAITQSDRYWRGKGIHYRMHPKNIACLTAAAIDCCVLANNHVMDWGYAGLSETLQSLQAAHIKTAGAGQDNAAAEAPAILALKDKGRVLVYALGHESSGVSADWAAGKKQPGINLLPDLSSDTVRQLARQIQATKQSGDLVVVSIHWGDNWGYDIPAAQRQFAHQLIERAGADIIHCHSSHHPKGIEVYRDKPILYGCGDLLNDYEGISGYETYRDDLALLYFVSMDPATAQLRRLHMLPTRIKRFRLQRASHTDANWLRKVLNREGRRLGTRVVLNDDDSLELQWSAG